MRSDRSWEYEVCTADKLFKNAFKTGRGVLILILVMIMASSIYNRPKTKGLSTAKSRYMTASAFFSTHAPFFVTRNPFFSLNL